MISQLDQPQKSLKKVNVFVVENRVGRKLLCEKSLRSRLLLNSSFRVIYKMKRECSWCLTEVMLQRGTEMKLFFSNEAISLRGGPFDF